MDYDISDWIYSQFPSVLSARGGQELRVNCPFCIGGDHSHHLYISTIKATAHCFKCDWSGTHAKLVLEATGADSYAEAFSILQGSLQLADYETVADRLEQHMREAAQVQQASLEMPDWFVPFSEGVDGEHAEIVFDYAVRRVGLDAALEHNFGYSCDPANHCAWRLVMPVESGFWQARLVRGAGTKYISPDEPLRGRLFNSDVLCVPGTLYITEGIISAIATGESAVALIGKHASQEQIMRIVESAASKLVVALDNDAESYALRLASSLADLCEKEICIRHYAFGDPDECNMWTDVPFDWGNRLFADLIGDAASSLL